MKASLIPSQPIIPKVHKIEKVTTKKGKNTPTQLRNDSISRKIHRPTATGVKTRISRCICSMIVALVMGRLDTKKFSGPR